jgi:hypothetical protein
MAGMVAPTRTVTMRDGTERTYSATRQADVRAAMRRGQSAYNGRDERAAYAWYNFVAAALYWRLSNR